MKLSKNLFTLEASSLALLIAIPLGSACIGSIPGVPGNSNQPGPKPNQPNQPPDTTPPTNPPPVSVGDCNETTLAKPRAWRLTHGQVKNTLRDTIGFSPAIVDTFPAEARIDQMNSRNGFANRADELKISANLADAYLKASDEIGAEVVNKASTFGLGCQVAGLGTGNCLKDFLAGFGTRMWRRPLSDAEIASLVDLYGKVVSKGDAPSDGLKTVVQALFLSPNFLYRSEIGHSNAAGTVTYLTSYELASALSYALWDTAPDAELFDLAKQDKLRNKDVLLAQAKRLIGKTDKSGAAIHSFVEQWLHTDDVTTSDKDVNIFPLGTPEMAKDLAAETRKFLDSVLFEQGGDKSFKTLFTANYSFVNARTAALYGVQGVTGDALVKTNMNPQQRRGLLTQGSFMWGHANPDGTHPVERGRYFREEILCEGVLDPPPGTIIDPQFGDATLSARERLTIHLKEPACAACHRLIDGLGLAMENYDGIGRYRTEEVVQGGARKPIDATGTVPLPSDGKTLEFKNLIDLVDQLAAKPDVYTCFASQYLDYSTGRRPGELNKCEAQLVTDRFVKSGYNVEELVLGVVSSPSFMARRN